MLDVLCKVLQGHGRELLLELPILQQQWETSQHELHKLPPSTQQDQIQQ
jgi:hypothetical protein